MIKYLFMNIKLNSKTKMSKSRKEGKKGKSRKSINKTLKLINHNNVMLNKHYDEMKNPS
jgi:hypothetical protein